MAHSCGECSFFKGAGNECGIGVANRHPATTSCVNGFKGPSSYFTGKRCGCCLLFEGPNKKCGGDRTGRGSETSSCGSYTPI